MYTDWMWIGGTYRFETRARLNGGEVGKQHKNNTNACSNNIFVAAVCFRKEITLSFSNSMNRRFFFAPFVHVRRWLFIARYVFLISCEKVSAVIKPFWILVHIEMWPHKCLMPTGIRTCTRAWSAWMELYALWWFTPSIFSLRSFYHISAVSR